MALEPAATSDLEATNIEHCVAPLQARQALIGVIGLGYVGQPLALTANSKGCHVVGFDIDAQRVAALNEGRSTLRTVSNDQTAAMRASKRFRATTNFSELAYADVIVICVPTPLSKNREPDLSFVKSTAECVARTLRAGQLICLESTSYPGTTAGVLGPLLEATGLKVGRDVFLAFSPEREDPGNRKFNTKSIPKIVGADDAGSRALAEAFYRSIVDKVVPVSSTATAEAVKLTENIFRSVNIALVNELKHVYGKMGINIWDVIDAASTKPFGFMPFYPGPGLGGHCIPIDPFYLTWKAREYEVPTRFIELAGEVNSAEPREVVNATGAALSTRKKLSLNGARILLMGLAYKKNVDDLRESPALVIMDDLVTRGAQVGYFDPWIPEIPLTRSHPQISGRKSIDWSPAEFASAFDA